MIFLCVAVSCSLALITTWIANNNFLHYGEGDKLSSASSSSTLEISDGDAISIPPMKREFSSPDGRHKFTVFTSDNWASKKAKVKLVKITENSQILLWSKDLPHEYGPRHVIVNNQGRILLLDEWINVPSNYAIVLLDSKGEIISQYSFDKLQRFLNISRAEIVEKAKEGWWIASTPTLDTSSNASSVGVAGKLLTIHLNDGHITSSDLPL